MRDFGSMLSFTLKNDDVEVAKKVLAHKIICTSRKSRRVESLINHPASMTHASSQEKKELKMDCQIR
jgi:cystathionine beta-lyase/cystathionine gamma-synthase